jgi:copper homeostasis protein
MNRLFIFLYIQLFSEWPLQLNSIGTSQMTKIVFELCAESVDACVAARVGGAHRIELCTALSEGGLTPSYGLLQEAIKKSGLPIHVLIRPRGGDFMYTPSEMEVMRKDLEYSHSVGASGVVLGVLCADGTVDIDQTRHFVEMAGPLEVTFNRAFDCTVSKERALEDVIAAGCKRVLTSGGEPEVVRGAESLARLVDQAAGRIDVAVGGGLRLNNAAAVARTTGAQHFHGSLRSRVASPMIYRGPGMLKEEGSSTDIRFVVDSQDVRQMIENLSNA